MTQTTSMEADVSGDERVIVAQEPASSRTGTQYPKPQMLRFDLGEEGLAHATHNILSANKLSVTLENIYGEKVILSGDLRSMLEVQYAIVRLMEDATRRVEQRPHWKRS